MKYQSVCLTLVLGFLMLWLIQVPFEKIINKLAPNHPTDGKFSKFISFAFRANICGVFAIINMMLCGNYSWYGIIFIAVLNFARTKKHRITWTVWGLVGLSIMESTTFSWLAIFVFLSLIFICISLYSEKCKLLYFKFLNTEFGSLAARYFYPAHLLILIGIQKLVSKM